MKKLFALAVVFFISSMVLVAAGAFGLYTYFKKNPVDIEPWAERSAWITSDWPGEVKMLANLSALSVAAGADVWSAKLLTRAGAILGSEQKLYGEDIKPLAKEYLQKAISASERVAKETSNYEPLLQARYQYALLMERVGDKKRAILHLRDSLDMAKQFSPESRWVQQFQGAIKEVSAP